MVVSMSIFLKLFAQLIIRYQKELIAFANCSGGTIYIGVKDNGTVVGLDDPDGAALQVSNMVRDAIKPDLTMFISFETIDIEEKSILAVTI